MVSGSRVVSVTFALILALTTLVGPLADALDVRGNSGIFGVFGVALLLAYALLSYNPDLYVDGVWHFAFLVFLLSIGIHYLLGTGLTSGNATPAQIVLVWLFAAGAVAVAFRRTVIEQLRA
ncbi:hypothetical protein ZOD2009_10050 [Haladaptatus paucihalophilus DX253]|uniref:Uncharacterized protein n=1 Tax=Haladaptatus paucihalophilus DX253 TaxID=797209 RepID=E7QT82_HALPU|nr:hypothetical protein [Haladaptatus paucihalophilus]EFW91811.1 hypothetical protein ZOD2009_10050 [Haladaptatus paucihalophilus DX253]SHK79857.1 hypothetical protein SAMN05444342_2213 [Haladaptatus paucihalophilus DX253]